MTHEELLVKISFDTTHQLREALRAVVELHKPIKWNAPDGRTIGEPFYDCAVCFEEQGEYMSPRQAEYPCPTIQAIEKELK